jgi:hypothetical protein
MKITLKNIKINETFSQETTMFKADVFVDGINVAYAENDGHGGNTYYNAHDASKSELLAKAEKFCLALPAHKYPAGHGMKAFEVKMNLEQLIDNLIEEELKKRDQKKLEKKMVNKIMWGVKGGHSYREVRFPKPLAQIPVAHLQGLVDGYKATFQEGEEFFNTNLQALGIRI